MEARYVDSNQCVIKHKNVDCIGPSNRVHVKTSYFLGLFRVLENPCFTSDLSGRAGHRFSCLNHSGKISEIRLEVKCLPSAGVLGEMWFSDQI